MTRETFMGLYETFKSSAVELFERDKSHIHIIMLLDASGAGCLVPFDMLMKEAASMAGDADFGFLKNVCFERVAETARMIKAVAYIQVFEAWVTNFIVDDQERNQPLELKIDKMHSKFQKMMQEHGSIEKTPGRIEVLSIRGVFADSNIMTNFKIGRRGDNVWLEGLEDFNKGLEVNKEVEISTKNASRQSMIDRIVFENAKEAGILQE